MAGTIDITVTPDVWGKVEGSVRVGDAIYATVDIHGVLMNTSLPLAIDQKYGSWPLTAR